MNWLTADSGPGCREKSTVHHLHNIAATCECVNLLKRFLLRECIKEWVGVHVARQICPAENLRLAMCSAAKQTRSCLVIPSSTSFYRQRHCVLGVDGALPFQTQVC